MNITDVIFLALAGLAVGAGIAWLVARSRIGALVERKSELERGLESTQARLAQQQVENTALVSAKATAEATLESERRSTKERLDLLVGAGEEMKAQFKIGR